MDVNKLKFAHKWSKYLTNLLSGLTHSSEVLRKRVELSNTRTAYVMHIPCILSLISARINSNRKF